MDKNVHQAMTHYQGITPKLTSPELTSIPEPIDRNYLSTTFLRTISKDTIIKLSHSMNNETVTNDLKYAKLK